MSVKNHHKDYDLYAPKWKRCRDVVAGQSAMHTAGKAYLPLLDDEKPKQYDARLKRSDFFNATWRTIDGLNGMAFRKPPTTDMPANIAAYLEDADMAGTDIDSLASVLVEDVLEVGRIGLLVDYPPAPAQDESGKQLTVAEAEAQGRRPSLQVYKTEAIINWHFARVANTWNLAMVVLAETVAVVENEFKEKTEPRYRVLDLEEGSYRQRVFKVDDKGNDIMVEGPIYPLMNGQPLAYIPFAIIGPGGRGDCIDEPPLIDLVDANVAHYQENSILRHVLHFAPPVFYVAGHTLKEGQTLKVGGDEALVFRDPNAKADFAEIKADAVPALERYLDRKERHMAVLGARMIADESQQVETLGATQIKRSGENSILARIVTAVSSGMEWALGIFSKWAGGPEKIEYQINRDFLPTIMDAQQLTALFAGVQGGHLSEPEMFDLLKRGDIIAPGKKLEEHQAEIDAAPPKVSPKPLPSNSGIAA